MNIIAGVPQKICHVNGSTGRLYKTTASISIASIITVMFWYLYAEYFFVRKYNRHLFRAYIFQKQVLEIISRTSLCLLSYFIIFLSAKIRQ